MSTPVTSVLLPVYNGQRYLARSVESVLVQTADEVEFLACDDGSADDSLSILKQYRDPRLRILSNATNLGLFPTLNRLIAESRGTHLRLWAQDDVMMPGCLEVEQAFWRTHPDLTMTYCQYERIDETGARCAEAPHDDTPEIIPTWLAQQIAFYWGSIAGNIANVTMSRRAVERAGCFGSFRVSGDFDMWVRLAAIGPIGFIKQPLVQVRSHAAQFSRSFPEWLTFIREDREIYSRLLQQLPEGLLPHARRYHLVHCGFRPINHALRCVLRGEVAQALRAVAELLREDDPVRLLWFWLVTANGRWNRPDPKYLPPEGGACLQGRDTAA